MERSWSDAAAAAFKAYPWRAEQERERARQEAELVAFGECVEVDDLPIAVRKWLRRRTDGLFSGWTWKGESWRTLIEGFEKAILSQALAANGGNGTAAARALGTTARVVAYKARKYGLEMNFRKKNRTTTKAKKEGK